MPVTTGGKVLLSSLGRREGQRLALREAVVYVKAPYGDAQVFHWSQPHACDLNEHDGHQGCREDTPASANMYSPAVPQE
jgi:hypothetical protein